MFHLSQCVFALIFFSSLFVIMIFRQMEAVWSRCSWLTPSKADHSGVLFLYYDFTLSALMTDQGCCSGWRRDENTDVCLDGGTDSVINGLKSCEQRRGEGGMYDLPSEGQMGLSWSRSRLLSLGSITLMPPFLQSGAQEVFSQLSETPEGNTATMCSHNPNHSGRTAETAKEGDTKRWLKSSQTTDWSELPSWCSPTVSVRPKWPVP